MTDIVAFLTARLDEDEAAASGASDGPWTAWRDKPGLGYPTLPFAIALPGQGPGAYAVMAAARWLDAEHIARHDPARVLAGVASKRAILKVHNTWSVVDPEAHYLAEERSCVGCGLDVAGDRLTQDVNKCPVLRALALPYADHPDYDPAWRP